jgi:hydroxypyruvate isomerase
MSKFCANLTMLYNEHSFLDRFAAARAASFGGVEYMFPYALARKSWRKPSIAIRSSRCYYNFSAGNWEPGERGIAYLPGRAIEYARVLKCGQLNCLVGLSPNNVDADRVRQTLVDNLRFAAGERDDGEP